MTRFSSKGNFFFFFVVWKDFSPEMVDNYLHPKNFYVINLGVLYKVWFMISSSSRISLLLLLSKDVKSVSYLEKRIPMDPKGQFI